MGFDDRTMEFANIIETLITQQGIKPMASRQPRRNQGETMHLNINQLTSEIGKDTSEITRKLVELTKLAKSKSLFYDPADQIEQLSRIIKTDIQSIWIKIEAINQLANHKNHPSKQSKEHYETILTTLRSNLTNTTLEFTKVLEIRTQNLKDQQDRKIQYIGPSHHNTTLYQSYSPTLEEDEGFDYNEDECQDISIALPLIQTREYFIEERSNSIRAVEKTVEELGTIMSQIATIARQQDELIMRIDEDIARSEFHVQSAYSQLLQYIPKITGNRWLYLKVFAILIVFMVLLVVFAI